MYCMAVAYDPQQLATILYPLGRIGANLDICRHFKMVSQLNSLPAIESHELEFLLHCQAVQFALR